MSKRGKPKVRKKDLKEVYTEDGEKRYLSANGTHLIDPKHLRKGKKRPRPGIKGRRRQGRESIYTDDLPKKMYDYYNEPIVEKVKLNGVWQYMPRRLPTLTNFAWTIGINYATLHSWLTPTSKYFKRELYDIYEQCKKICIDKLSEGALLGHYSASYAKFLAVNISNMRDKKEVDHGITEDLFEKYKNMSGIELKQRVKLLANELIGDDSDSDTEEE